MQNTLSSRGEELLTVSKMDLEYFEAWKCFESAQSSSCNSSWKENEATDVDSLRTSSFSHAAGESAATAQISREETVLQVGEVTDSWNWQNDIWCTSPELFEYQQQGLKRQALEECEIEKKNKASALHQMGMCKDKPLPRLPENELMVLARPMAFKRTFKLVLDLDFTVVHSVSRLKPSRKAELLAQAHVSGWKGFLVNEQACSKLRPGTLRLVQAVGERCEVSICTLGTQAYANQIARVYDPTGTILGNRVFSKRPLGLNWAAEATMVKDLQGICKEEDAAHTLIVDDLRRVWPKNKENLITCVPYKFFAEAHSDHAHVPPLVQTQDEDEETGPLSRVTEIILEVISIWDKEGGGNVSDILQRMKKRVLDGLHIAVFGFQKDKAEKLRGLAKVFGATVEDSMVSPSVTHVVISERAATSCNVANGKGKSYVTSMWLEVSAQLYTKQAESLFEPRAMKEKPTWGLAHSMISP